MCDTTVWGKKKRKRINIKKQKQCFNREWKTWKMEVFIEKSWNKKDWQKSNFAPKFDQICASFVDIEKFSISSESIHFPIFSAKRLYSKNPACFPACFCHPTVVNFDASPYFHSCQSRGHPGKVGQLPLGALWR